MHLLPFGPIAAQSTGLAISLALPGNSGLRVNDVFDVRADKGLAGLGLLSTQPALHAVPGHL
jgi:hypothetical protein